MFERIKIFHTKQYNQEYYARHPDNVCVFSAMSADLLCASECCLSVCVCVHVQNISKII